MAGKLGVSRQEGVLVSVLLLVLVLDSHHTLIFIPVVSFGLGSRQINTNILSESLLDDTVSSKLFSRVDHHLTDGPAAFD